MPEKADKFKEVFLGLFTANQCEIYTYILALIPQESEAEDIFQETCSVMWRKFDEFEQGSFSAWGCKIAYYVIMEHRRKAVHNRVCFSSETIRMLSDEYEELKKDRDYRVDTLNKCLRALSARERTLVQLRYNRCLPVQEIATIISMSVNNIYKVLAKIHYFLHECVQRSMAAEESK